MHDAMVQLSLSCRFLPSLVNAPVCCKLMPVYSATAQCGELRAHDMHTSWAAGQFI